MYLFRGLCHYATHEKTDSAAYIAYYVFCFCHLNELLLVALYAMHYYYRYLYTGERPPACKRHGRGTHTDILLGVLLIFDSGRLRSSVRFMMFVEEDSTPHFQSRRQS